ncbi:hypothetical protein BJ138DRAFT_439324 [Hygrophoropsis aurantiaca]|uniref:Uncharacterized protein n=1 Tax=Hygrophoropsis aurantiaca TaxID=72124 RepID=A0ACB8A3K3_9AGAM|nr:hypothetical protein BJ138DRAFT_439324 [Hygrophoropsis aurantiaca]
MSDVGLTLDDFWVSRITSYNACASLIMVFWDWLITLGDEINMVWKIPHARVAKWVYIFLRYGAIGFQIFNMIFVLRMETYAPIHNTHCKLWLSYQGVVCQTMSTLVEGLLMMRVYLLWNRNRKIALALFGLVALEMCAMVSGAKMVIPDQRMNDLCMFSKPPIGAIFFMIAFIVTQTVVIILLLARRSAAYRFGWNRVPLYMIVVRDAKIMFLVIFSLFLTGIVYMLVGSGHGGTIFYWTVSMLSICGCRTILNSHKLPSSSRTSSVCLTTDIWIENESEHSSHTSQMEPDQ